MKKRINKLIHVGTFMVIASLLLALGTVAIAQDKKTVVWGVVWNAPERDRLVEIYNGRHPEVLIKQDFITTEKLTVSIAAGNPSDFAMFDRSAVARWALKGALAPLSEFAAAGGMKAEDYVASAWNQLFWEGEMYCMPAELDARALFWNKGLFKEAGLDPERPPVTIAELDEYAEKLTEKRSDGSYETLGFIPWHDQGWIFKLWAKIFGGEFVDPETGRLSANDPKLLDALNWMMTYVDKYGTSRMTGFAEGWAEAIASPFYANTLGMMVSGNWQLGPNHISKYAPGLDYGVAPIPSPPGGVDNYTLVWGWANVIPKGSANIQEAFDFLQWLAEPEGQMLWTAPNGVVQYFPFNKIALQDPVFYQGKHKVFMELVRGDGADAWEASPEVFVALDEGVTVVDNAIYRKMTPEEALKLYDERLLKAWEERVEGIK